MLKNYTLKLTLSWAFFLIYFWSGVLLQILYCGGTALGLAYKAWGWGAVCVSFVGHAILMLLFLSCFKWLLKKPGNASLASYKYSMNIALLATFIVPIVWLTAENNFSVELMIKLWFAFALTTNIPLMLSMFSHGYRISQMRQNG